MTLYVNAAILILYGMTAGMFVLYGFAKTKCIWGYNTDIYMNKIVWHKNIDHSRQEEFE